MKKYGIERQAMAVALVPIMILAVLLESSFIFTRIMDLDQALRDRAWLIARQLASSSEYAAFSGNRLLLQQQAEAALSQQDVIAVSILGGEGESLAAASGTSERRIKPPDWRNGQTQREERTMLVVYQPILATQLLLDDADFSGAARPHGKLGGVVVALGKQRLNHAKIEMVSLSLILTLLVLLLAMLVAMRVARHITMPIMGMRTAVRELGQGLLDTRISEMQVRELNELAHGINEMAMQLQQERQQLQQRIDEATQALRGQKEQAEKASFDKTRFLAAASHDLRQPMHALGLFMGELHDRLDTPEQQRVVHKVEEAVAAMSGLLDSLLDISKLDAGVIVPQVQEMDIDMLLQRLSDAYAPMAAAKSITLRVHGLPVRVKSDPILLERILMNLLGNAIRYTPEHGTVLLACRRRGDRLRIEVRDNGPGIPQHEQENIFREFVQLENAARDRSKGLGLGLPIVQRCARLLGHPVSVSSTPGHGSVFAIEVLRVLELRDLILHTGPLTSVTEGESPAGQFGSKHILVVDDDELVRNGTASLVSAWGCEVASAGELGEARRLLANGHYDLVVCDYRLPDGDGLALADGIDVRGTQPAFILISGDTSPDILKLVAERGVHLLHKPVRPAKLRSMIAFLLKGR